MFPGRNIWKMQLHNHEAAIEIAIDGNDRSGSSELIYSSVSEKESILALAVDQYLKFNHLVRCICKFLAQVINKAIGTAPFPTSVLERINSSSSYVWYHRKIGSKMVEMQYRQYSRDQIATLNKEGLTRWCSKRNVAEKYIILKPVLYETLLKYVPTLLDDAGESCDASCADVFLEVRRVAQALEADKWVTASQNPTIIIKDLLNTLKVT